MTLGYLFLDSDNIFYPFLNVFVGHFENKNDLLLMYVTLIKQ